LMRAHGAGEMAAWTVQAIGSAATAVGLIWLWRSRVPFELKAAGLAAGALIATPYLYMYDLVVLAVAVAFLLRLMLERGFLTSEIVGLPVAGALLLAFPYVETQVGLAAALIVMALVAQRALLETRNSRAA
jgi:arabinofuranan 3-O-arabinosyltransferase